jgi:hypothetical protein
MNIMEMKYFPEMNCSLYETHIHMNIYEYMYVCMYTYICVYVYVDTYGHMRVYMC